ncbi:MAG: sialate O-acetylesterase [Pseudomonadota bacterium]
MSGLLSLGLGLGLSKASSQGASSLTPRIFLLIGQSNMVGRASFDGGSVHPSLVMQLGRGAPNDGVLIPTSIPLEHVDPHGGDMGLDITFSIDWAAANPFRSLILVPSADGGTSLGSGTWQKAGERYEDAVSRANAAMASVPGATFAGFLWHQGEADTNNQNYQSQLDQMIADFRSDVTGAANAPFILGGFSDDYVGSSSGRIAMRDIVLDTPNRVPDTAVANASDLTVFDGVHFDAPSLRTLGTRYFAAFASIAITAPSAVGAIPDQTDVLALAPPVAVGSIPDQTDLASLAPPAAVGAIPDQMDVAA